MSALWQRAVVTKNQTHYLPAQLEPRTVPQLFAINASGLTNSVITSEVLRQTLTDPVSNWMYGAVTHLAYDGATPSWSRDDWSFAPVDLISLMPTTKPIDVTKNVTRVLTVTKQDAVDGDVLGVTVDTVAIRARLECSPLDLSSNTS